MFLKNVQEKGMEGGVSQRALNSKFASDLPISVINEITERRKNRRYSNLSVFQAKNSFNDGAFTGSSSNFSLFQAKNSFNNGASTNYPSYGGRKGIMASSSSSSSFLTRDFKFGDTSNQNHSIVGNDSFNHFTYGVKNWSVGSTSNSKNLLKNVTFSSINNRPTEVGTGTTNKGRFDNVTPYSFGFDFTGRKENMSGSEVDARLVNDVNVSENRGIHLHKSKAVVENEGDFNRMELNISDFLVADDINLHNEVCKHRETFGI